VTAYWALATTFSNCEDIATRNLQNQNIIAYAPKYRKVHFRRSARHERICQLFPGYLFVRVAESWRSLLSTRGISGVVGGSNPSYIDDGVVDELIATEKANEGAVPLPWVIGSTLRVKRGALTGQLVIYDGMGKHERERVLLKAMGGHRPINIMGCDLEAVA
jgi:transcription antitermination factor NusG